VKLLLVTFKLSFSLRYFLLSILVWCKTWSVLIAMIMLLSSKQRDRKFSETFTGAPNRHNEWLDIFCHFIFFSSVVQRYFLDHLFQGLTPFTAERTSTLRLHSVIFVKYVVKIRKKSICRRVLLIYRVIDTQAYRFSARRSQFKPQTYM